MLCKMVTTFPEQPFEAQMLAVATGGLCVLALVLVFR
jgi:hypothetical protein